GNCCRVPCRFDVLCVSVVLPYADPKPEIASPRVSGLDKLLPALFRAEKLVLCFQCGSFRNVSPANGIFDKVACRRWPNGTGWRYCSKKASEHCEGCVD